MKNIFKESSNGQVASTFCRMVGAISLPRILRNFPNLFRNLCKTNGKIFLRYSQKWALFDALSIFQKISPTTFLTFFSTLLLIWLDDKVLVIIVPLTWKIFASVFPKMYTLFKTGAHDRGEGGEMVTVTPIKLVKVPGNSLRF